MQPLYSSPVNLSHGLVSVRGSLGGGSLLLEPFNSNRFWSKEICNGRLSLWAAGAGRFTEEQPMPILCNPPKHSLPPQLGETIKTAYNKIHFGSTQISSGARWEMQLQLYDPPLLYLDGKCNSKTGLFSSTFLFERSFGCHLALLVFWPLSWENGSETVQKMQFSKIGLKPTQKL